MNRDRVDLVWQIYYMLVINFRSGATACGSGSQERARAPTEPDDGSPGKIPDFLPEFPPGIRLPEGRTREDVSKYLAPGISFNSFEIFVSFQRRFW